MHFLVGIEKTGDGFTIRMSDQDYCVTEERLEADFYEPFFNQIHAALAQPPAGQPKSSFGFGVFTTRKEQTPPA